MKRRDRWIGLVLVFVMTVNLFVFLKDAMPVQGGQDVIQCKVAVLSNEYEESQINIYAKEDRFYLSVEDIADFTRCSIEEDTSKINLTQGVRRIVIEKKTGHMYDFGGIDQGEVLFFEQAGTYFYEAIPMLTYLGASCEVGEENVLEIYMPMYTIWEAIMPEYEMLLFDMEVIHGSEFELKGNLICAMISDILDVRKGHGIFANGNTYIEDALYEILKLDMMQYSLVQTEVAAQNQAANAFLSSERVQNYLNQQEKLEEAARNLVKKYISVCKATKSEEAFGDFRKLYDETIKELGIKDEKKLGNYIKAGSLVFDIMKTSQEIIDYDEAAKTLFARTINDEVLTYAGYQDIMWSENAKKLSKELESNQSIVVSAAIDKLIDAALDEVKDKGVEYVLSKFVLEKNIYATTLELAGYIASSINSDLHEAFYSKRSAVYLNMIQYDAIKLLDGLLLNCKEKEQFSDEKTLENIKSVLELYYRASAAFSAHMAKSVEQFGEGNKAEVSKYFKEDVGNAAALYLYRVTNCKVVPIGEYQELAENCRTGVVAEDIGRRVIEKKQQLQEMESYIAKAERYVKVGNYDKAREVLQEGYSVSGAEELMEMMVNLYLEQSDKYLRERDYEMAVMMLIEGQWYSDAEILKEREVYLRENIVMKRESYYEGGKEISMTQYDEKGNRVKYIWYDQDGYLDEWTEYEYEFDSRGNWIKKLCYEGYYIFGGTLSGWTELKYDSNDKYIEETCYDAEGNIERWYEYEYDNEENCIKERCYDKTGELDTWHEYEYDNLGNRIREKCYDRIVGMMYYYEWEYDTNSRCITEYMNYGSGEWLKEYEYDNMGNCMKILHREVSGVVKSWREYEYNVLGDCVRYILYNSSGEETECGEYKYSYDFIGEERF